MAKELKSNANGKSGARTFTLTDISKGGDGKKNRSQIGKLKVQKSSLVWYDGYETGNNRFEISWDDFIKYIKKHPAK